MRNEYNTHPGFLLNLLTTDNFLLNGYTNMVVGSSAINNCGLQAIAIAIITRCFALLKSHEDIYRIIFPDSVI
jgi:hypothetical protein